MNVRHAYSKEDPSPDERYIWGSLVDDSDALALLRIAYAAGQLEEMKASADEVEDAYNEGYEEGVMDARDSEAAA